MCAKPVKTNAMRLLDQARVPYEVLTYPVDESDLSGVTAAAKMGLPEKSVFNTLVLRGEKNGVAVCVIPVAMNVDLKALAAACKEKKMEMVPMKEILGLTGYIRGGCSPVGMKKPFPTFFDQTAGSQPTIMVSAGKIGTQVEVEPSLLISYVKGTVVPLTKEA